MELLAVWLAGTSSQYSILESDVAQQFSRVGEGKVQDGDDGLSFSGRFVSRRNTAYNTGVDAVASSDWASCRAGFTPYRAAWRNRHIDHDAGLAVQ